MKTTSLLATSSEEIMEAIALLRLDNALKLLHAIKLIRRTTFLTSLSPIAFKPYVKLLLVPLKNKIGYK